jgi:hypothetical protein
MKATKLSIEDIAAIQPKYVIIPQTWAAVGTRGVVDKRGNGYTLINFMTENNIQVSFFADKMAKNEQGQYVVEAMHYNEQMVRAEAYNKNKVKDKE